MPEITFCVLPFEPSPVYAGRLGEGSETGCGEEGGVGIWLSMMSCCAPVLWSRMLVVNGPREKVGTWRVTVVAVLGDGWRLLSAG